MNSSYYVVDVTSVRPHCANTTVMQYVRFAVLYSADSAAFSFTTLLIILSGLVSLFGWTTLLLLFGLKHFTAAFHSYQKLI